MKVQGRLAIAIAIAIAPPRCRRTGYVLAPEPSVHHGPRHLVVQRVSK
jgi:hypothetical protein